MHHPFEGIIGADQAPSRQLTEIREAPLAPSSRRTFFAQTLGLAVGAAAVATSRPALAQQTTGQRDRGSDTHAAQDRNLRREDNRVTTQALGEEGGGYGGDGRYTTQALGEEGGRSGDGRYTTYALGEEGAGQPGWPGPPRRGRYTTMALGEEGAWMPDPRYRPPYFYRPPYYYRPPRSRPGDRYTTQALGEEGGWR
jgi:hypothetical protein